jgi:hypothetical protein
MADPERSREVLSDLSEMGVSLSIDDFGTGYSSLSQMKRLPVNEIKIDKSFVMGMARDENDAVIVRLTIDLAHNLGLRVVAEGVESENDLNLLRAWGCDVAQGYYLSRPLPMESINDWSSGFRPLAEYQSPVADRAEILHDTVSRCPTNPPKRREYAARRYRSTAWFMGRLLPVVLIGVIRLRFCPMEERNNTTNTLLWIAVLVLVTLLLNQGDDGGVAAIEDNLQAPNAEERLAKTLAPVEQPFRTLNNLCTPEVRALIDELRAAKEEGDEGRINSLETQIFDRLDGSLGKLIAADFVQGEPNGVDLVKYDSVTSVARNQVETFHGISKIFGSVIGNCGEAIPE